MSLVFPSLNSMKSPGSSGGKYMDPETYKLLVYHLKKALDTFDLDEPMCCHVGWFYGMIKAVHKKILEEENTLLHPDHDLPYR